MALPKSIFLPPAISAKWICRILMKKLFLTIGILIGALMLSGEQGCADKTPPQPLESESQNFKGEKITYAIRKLNVKAGTATLLFNGPAKIDGRDSVLITFTADGLNF